MVTTFAVFCLRAIEQARLSLAYARRNAKIVASHPGLDVGPDGGSAQALEDLAAFRAIPGMTVISPADPIEMALATRAILEFDGPVYMRTGRSPAKRVFGDDHTFEIGKGQIVRDGSDVTIVACGVEVARALEAADAPGRRRHLAPASSTWRPSSRSTPTLLARCAGETGAIVTAEDHNIYGGLGGAVAEALAATMPCPIEFVGVRDTFGASGEPEELADAFRDLARPSSPQAARRVIARKKRMNRVSRSPAKCAVVTGGSRGIGRAIALGLAEAGADVRAHLSRTARRSRRRCARRSKHRAASAQALQMDVTDRASVEAAARDARHALRADFDPGQQCRHQQAHRFRPGHRCRLGHDPRRPISRARSSARRFSCRC